MNDHDGWEQVWPVEEASYRLAPAVTVRMRVPGGWLYRHVTSMGFSMAFVPDVVALPG